MPRYDIGLFLKYLARLSAALLQAAVCCLVLAFPVRAAQKVPNVLIIFPLTQDFPVHIQLARGFRDRILQSGRPVHITYEYLDMTSFADQRGYLAMAARYFEAKYALLKPDVVVSGGPLREFFDAFGERMFPGVPVVFPEAENAALEAIPEARFNPARQSDLMKSVDVIFKTRPSTKRVIVVLGSSDEERDMERNMEQVARRYAGRATFEFTSSLSFEGLLEDVRGAGKDSAVLLMRWLRDVQGRTFIPEDVMKAVCARSSAPVYSVVGPVGDGSVGGYVFSFELFGRQLAQRTLDILDGNAHAARLPLSSASEYVFDWRQLTRWGIDEGVLPEGSRVEFREISLWSAHKMAILGMAAIFILEAGLIAGLTINRARRRKVELELKELNLSLEEIVESRTRQLLATNSELEEAKRKLEVMNTRLDLASRTDSLTGLFNRRHLEEVADREHARYRRTGDVYSVIMCDIDHFKDVNDRHGHDAGDFLLRTMAEEISRSIRPYDTLARWGGEEFLLFLPRTERAEAEHFAERIRERIRAGIHVYHGKDIRVTATFGVSSIERGEEFADAVRRADQAMYEGKRTGRDRVIVG